MAEGGTGETWIQKQVLGQGAFGCITLWLNERTQEKIAIKNCRHKDDLSDKTSDRWRMEVYIMSRLNHDNVIRSVELPDHLKPRPGELPILAMEYCEGGDLRKVLNRPENCCGLKETDIRQLVSGVGSAIEYLHSNRIIHRDLKPENIVLKPIENNRILYKVIDLGYAKELDVTSICNSYVGTMQYLAPELFVSKPYTKTVDYWSFGSLVFECIAGFRPFLPTLPPVEWHNVVCRKSPDDINATYDENREVRFSKKLPPNQLCRPLQNYFEQWLRLMLRWDPKARGGGVVQLNGVERPKCFCLLEKILDLKILHILHVEGNTVLSYPVNESHTMQDVQGAIQQEMNIPTEQQYILLADGTKLDEADSASVGCRDANSEDLVVFLYRLGPVQVQQKYVKKLPLLVQAIAKEPNTLLPAKDHRKAWAQAIYWFSGINTDYKRLVSAHRAAQLNFMKNIRTMNKFKSEVCSEIGKLMACKDLFQTSLEFDLKQFQEVLHNDPVLHRIFQEWKQMAEKINDYNNLMERVDLLDRKTQSFTSEIAELQKKPNTGTELEEFETKAKNLYAKLLHKNTQGNGTYEMMDHNAMVDLVSKCFLKRDELTRVLYKHLSKILECLEKLLPILPELETSYIEIEAASKQLKSMQCRRQEDIWKLLANSRSGGSNGDLVRPSIIMAESSMSYMPNLESLQLMDDNRTYTQKLQEMMETVVKEQEESLKFISSLDSSTR